MIKHILIVIVFILLLGGCKGDTFKQTQIWEIDGLNQIEENKLKFHSNVLVFRKDGSCKTPRVDFLKESSCNCQYSLSNDSIIIDSCSPVFIGGFKLSNTNVRLNYILTNEKYQIKVSDAMLPLHNITNKLLKK
jgi:hypothetical protein